MDQGTRKLMTMDKALWHRDDIDTLYKPAKEGERGLASIQDCVYALIQQLKDNIKKHGGRLITATRNNTENTCINRTKVTRNQNEKKKTTVWTFQVTNKRNLTREELNMAKKGKP